MLLTPYNRRHRALTSTVVASMPFFAVWASFVLPRHIVQSEGASGTCEKLRLNAVEVPKRMELPPSMKTKLDKVPLMALDFTSDDEIRETPTEGKDAISMNTGQYGSVCFVVRRPG